MLKKLLTSIFLILPVIVISGGSAPSLDPKIATCNLSFAGHTALGIDPLFKNPEGRLKTIENKIKENLKFFKLPDFEIKVIETSELIAKADIPNYRIYLSTSILKEGFLSDSELTAVLAHELGHLTQVPSCPKEASVKEKHSSELKADLFAKSVLIYLDKDPQAMSSALLKIIEDKHLSNETHPSVEARLKNLEL